MSYKVMVDGLCFTKGIETRAQAKLHAIGYIESMEVADLSDVTITIVNEATDSTILNATIRVVTDWQDARPKMY